MTTFRVLGVPAPQGSKSVFNGHVVEGSSKSGREKHKTWRSDVAEAALKARGDAPPLSKPVHVSIDFVMPRPKSAPKSAYFHSKKPDIDKLVRSVLDSLKTAGMITDDSIVVGLLASKRYADPNDPWTGATIALRPA